MRKTLVGGLVLLALGLVVFSVLSLNAGGRPQYWVKLYSPGIINGTVLKPGDYRLEIRGKKAIFFKNKKEVARSGVWEEELGWKNDLGSVVFQGSAISEIRLAGKNTKLVLENSHVAGGRAEGSSKSSP